MEDIKDGKEEVLDEVVMDSSRINRFTHGLPPEYKSLLFKWVKNLTIKNERLFKLGKIENPRCDFCPAEVDDRAHLWSCLVLSCHC